MQTRTVDGRYYQVAAPRSLGEKIVVAARDRIYEDFLKICKPSATSSILDVGVSDVVNDAANVLERKYPYPSRITAAGIGLGEDFRAEYPSVAYAQIEANRPLPFADSAFDIATSNAVLEHVGSYTNQKAFVAELLRVARQVFITVPHRYFPIEHHTAFPLLHFSRPIFMLACRMTGKVEWANESNLILMSQQSLAACVPSGCHAKIGLTGLPLGPFSSNAYLYIDHAHDAELQAVQ